MKTHRLFCRSVVAVSLAAVLCFHPSRLGAQDKPRGSSSGKASSADSAAPTYVLEVANGALIVTGVSGASGRKTDATLGNVVNALRDMHPEANIAMAPELAQIRIADLKLRAAELDSEIEALRVASGSKF